MRLGINGRFLATRQTGVQRFARELCTLLFERAECVLFLPANAPEVSFPGVQVVRGGLRGAPWEQVVLPHAASTAHCDIVLHPANSAPLRGGPHAVIVHDLIPLEHPEWFAARYALWHRRVVLPAIRRAAIVFAPSQFTADQVVRAGVAADRVQVIRQGLAPFVGPASRSDVQQTLARYQLTPGFLLAVGWGDPRKNIEFLFPVLEQLRRELSPAPELVVVGKPLSRVHGQQAPALPGWVRHIESPTDDQLRALYTEAAVLCFPSRAEGFGRPPIEALVCGTPAIVADYAAAREALREHATILPLDQQLWAAHLRAALEKAESADSVRARTSHWLARFRWEDAAESVLERLYQEIEPRARRGDEVRV